MTNSETQRESKYRECYHNKWGDKPQCGAVARWMSVGAGNFTDGWTWCDEHVSAAEDYRRALDYTSAKTCDRE